MLQLEDTKDRLLAKLSHQGIADEAVLKAIKSIPREEFLDEGDLRLEAYDDVALPIACAQTISQPYVVAYMTEALKLNSTYDVLEIGTGSGYHTAVLASIARHVYTVERHQELHGRATERLKRLGIENVTAIVGDGTKGWPGNRKFDRIIVSAAPRELPQGLFGQLAEGGRLVVPIGKPKQQRLHLIENIAGEEHVTRLMAVRFVPLLADH